MVLKTLGATRWALIRALALEFAFLGLAAALVGIACGALAAWFVVVKIMDLPYAFSFGLALAAAAGTTTLAIGLGLTQSWRILGQKPARRLREL